VGGSLTLYALRTATISARASYTLASREAFLLLNNILLVIAMALVLLGTLYPLAYELATDGAKISVGVPYYNASFVPIMLVLSAALGVAPVLNWKRTPSTRLLGSLGWVAGLSLALGVALPLMLADAVSWQVMVTLVLALWILFSHGADLYRRARKGSLPLAYLGMQTAHLGFAVTLIGVAVTSIFSVERDLRMVPGESIEVGALSFRFVGVDRVNGPNYLADQGEFVVVEDGRRYTLRPEKRSYLARQSVMTEAAIDPGLLRDVYLSLGEPLGDGAWAVRVQVKPFVRWIWLGGLLMALGGVLAVLDARYRRLKVRQARTAGAVAAEAAP
jgi:cytochrome c-type biogenesis protein CcmF